MEHDEMVRLYGAWAGRTPSEAATAFAGYDGPWWIAGGWSLEAFSGVRRQHDDLDPCVLRSDLPRLRRHLAGRLDVWSASEGALCPLLPADRPDASADELLPPQCEQVWTRPSAAEPWEYDVLLAECPGDEWVYKRDASIRMPRSDALWERGAVAYLQPEIVLLHKARALRTKDRADFDATLPHLDARRRRWLRDAVAATESPNHPWVTRLG